MNTKIIWSHLEATKYMKRAKKEEDSLNSKSPLDIYATQNIGNKTPVFAA